MCDRAIENSGKSRDTSFVMLKGLAVVFVVMAQCGGPQWLTHLSSFVGFPLFFLCAGYFFHKEMVSAPMGYLRKRAQHLYLPFWGWSVFFLIFHNFFYWIGFIGQNGIGSAGQTYGWHSFFQHVWSITFNMSGYDPSMCSSFWFFRSMFIASLVFYGLFILLSRCSKWRGNTAVAVTIIVIGLLMALWMVAGDLSITGIAEGGYSELLALVLMGIGFVYHQYQDVFVKFWWTSILGLVFLLVGVVWLPATMEKATDLLSIFSLLITASAGFVVLHAATKWLVKHGNRLIHGLVYIGDRSLYVIGFHVLAFKLVSVFKVLVYGLSWSFISDTPIIKIYAGEDFFFLFYLVVGVGLPLLVVYLWKKMDKSYNLTWYNCLVYSLKGLQFTLNLFWKILKSFSLTIWKSIKGFFSDMKDFVKASNPKDE